LLNNVLSVGRKLTQDSAHEFFEIDDAVAVAIEDGEYLISLWPIAANPVVVEGLAELTKIESATAIGVHDLELPSQANQPFGTTLDELLAEAPNNQLVLLLVRHGAKTFCLIFERLLSVSDVLSVLLVDGRHEGVSCRFKASNLSVQSLGLIWDTILLVVLRVVKA
jgi:hypothetical protein